MEIQIADSTGRDLVALAEEKDALADKHRLGKGWTEADEKHLTSVSNQLAGVALAIADVIVSQHGDPRQIPLQLVTGGAQ
jgi:hypothetical protein